MAKQAREINTVISGKLKELNKAVRRRTVHNKKTFFNHSEFFNRYFVNYALVNRGMKYVVIEPGLPKVLSLGLTEDNISRDIFRLSQYSFTHSLRMNKLVLVYILLERSEP